MVGPAPFPISSHVRAVSPSKRHSLWAPVFKVLEDMGVFLRLGLGGVPNERYAGARQCLALEAPRRTRPGPGSLELRFDTSRPFFQSKYEQVQKNLGEVQKQLEEAQQKIQLSDLERSHTAGGEQTGTLAVRCG